MAKIRFTTTLTNDRETFLVNKEYEVTETVAGQCVRGGVAVRVGDEQPVPHLSGDMRAASMPASGTVADAGVPVAGITAAAVPDRQPIPPNTVVHEVPGVTTTTVVQPVIVQQHHAGTESTATTAPATADAIAAEQAAAKATKGAKPPK